MDFVTQHIATDTRGGIINTERLIQPHVRSKYGRLTIVHEYVTPEVVLVKGDDIRAAQAAHKYALRVVAGPSGAATYAALLSGLYGPASAECLAVLTCGANTTSVRFD